MSEATLRRNKPYAVRMTPDRRREQLLDAVLGIIATDGVGAVSVDRVARSVEVSRPVVYGVFTDTDDMLRASLDREEQRALAQLMPALTALASDDLAASLVQLAETYLLAVAAVPQRWRAIYLIADSATPALHRRVERGRTALAAQLESVLRGSARFDAAADLEMVARYLLAALWDSGRLLLTHPNDYPHDRLLSAMRRLITALIPARENRG